jgi:hypothetical protein
MVGFGRAVGFQPVSAQRVPVWLNAESLEKALFHESYL